MDADFRYWIRLSLCVAFVASLYGGMTLLTAVMFARGYILVAILSGVLLSLMTATALALFGLAWALTANDRKQEAGESVVQSG